MRRVGDWQNDIPVTDSIKFETTDGNSNWRQVPTPGNVGTIPKHYPDCSQDLAIYHCACGPVSPYVTYLHVGLVRDYNIISIPAGKPHA